MIEIEGSLREEGEMSHRCVLLRVLHTLDARIRISSINVTKYLHIDVCRKLRYIRVDTR